MQLTHGEWKEFASTAPRHDGMGAMLQAVTKPGRRRGILASLFLASAGYVVFGGSFEWPSAPEPAVTAVPTLGYVMDVARVQLPAEENQFQAYTAWLATAHAHAALYGQDAPLPSQF
jgi:hypothetical protein